jgi:hypothetical protein
VLRDASAGPADIAARVRALGLDVQSADTVVPSLEDVFLDVVDKASGQVA